MYVLIFIELIIENGCGEYEVLYNGMVVYIGIIGDGGSVVMVVVNGEVGILIFCDVCDNDCFCDVMVLGVEFCDFCVIELGIFIQGDCEYVNGVFIYVLIFIVLVIENGCGEYEVLYNGMLVYIGIIGDVGSLIIVVVNGEVGMLIFQDVCDSDCVIIVMVFGVELCDFCIIVLLNFI